ncbi:4-coumarate--CoA ligase-like 9 [Pistacia vera]|uniref:4-coumarate--CoA ligase-like 9 n=1 Tax=Pistacia vera TaxID=55513 RepID=UPI0012632B0E|nr:4-coumarate--CoA ligase-like 9 [Pistacia vera]
MANQQFDPRSGFCSQTNIYHSPRRSVPLPPLTTPLSITSYLFSILNSHPPPPHTAALIDALTRRRILYSDFILRIKTLAFSLKTKFNLSKNDTAFVLSQNSIHVPILYFSLFLIGVTVSPSNPANTKPEILRQIQLSKPVIAFATSEAADIIPSLKCGTILLDSLEFESFMTSQLDERDLDSELDRVSVSQLDPAAILYSSGTTGMIKGVVLTQRNWISSLAGALAVRSVRETPAVALCAVPYFHVYGFRYCVTALALGQSLVCMGRFDFGVFLRAIEELRVNYVALAPPIVFMMAQDGGSMNGYDLSKLESLACGGAPLTLSIIKKLKQRLPQVQLAQGYGLTESTGRVFGTEGPKECQVVGATGKLAPNCEAKIVDPDTGIAQPPGKPGELWIRGSFNMKGYVGDEEATANVLDSAGWLRTGDLCYIDNEGFLFYLDRIKELIKYKGYQVAPAELEHLLQSHPDIVDAAVIPYPDELAGQVPMAFVVRKCGRIIDESKIMDFINKQVAPYKRIRQVNFINSLPRNASGKVLRKELIKLAQSSTISKL